MNQSNTHVLQIKGSEVAYSRVGKGPSLIFAHCSSASHKEWLFAARKLSKSHDCWLPDLMGYGQTSNQFDDFGELVPCRDIDIIEAIVNRAESPVDLIAHSFGASVCLEYALLRPEAVRSLFLVEPVSFQLLNDGEHQQEWRLMRSIAEKVIRMDETGYPKRAADHYMRFWIGWFQWAFAPKKFKSNVIKSISKVAYEFSLIYEFPDENRRLNALDIPITLVSGGRSPKPAHAVVEILASRLPKNQHLIIERAGHMSPFTHTDKVMQLINGHFSNTLGNV
ncbi:MAG: alpha/beta hydrolase [Candidatus Thiodiazotropha sp.]